MEGVYRSGKVKAIGVSNFSIPYLENLQRTWTIVPAVNQVELHPYCPQHRLKEWCEDKGILLEAYCPLGSTSMYSTLLHNLETIAWRKPRHVHQGLTKAGSPLLTDPDIIAMAEKYRTSPASILISYQVNRGCIVLPKSVTPSRIEDNLKVLPISKEDMDILEGMATGGKQQRVNTPLWGHDLVSWCISRPACTMLLMSAGFR